MRLDSASADRVTALVLFLLGAAASWGGFAMDRLEVRRIHPASIPGLLPMILGVALMICALALAWSTRSPRDPEATDAGASWQNLVVVIVWSALYALVAVGTLPFALATGVYIGGFTLWFLWADRGGERRPGVLSAVAVLAFAVVMAVGISSLFRYGFLVRLP
jgi:putative tricarboxylic transport membrane protein